MQVIMLASSSIGLGLGVFGSGGSVLALPALVYLAGQSPKVAITGSLFIVAMISAATLLLSPSKRYIQWKYALMLGVPGVIGTNLGATIATLVSGAVQLLVFAILMFLASFLMWRKYVTPIDASKVPMSVLLTAGLVVGFCTGFAGVGGGFLLLPALVMIAKLDFIYARATSLLLISTNALVGFVKNAWLLAETDQSLNWPLLLSIAILGIVGAIGGQQYTAHWPQQRLRRGFAIFLVVLAMMIIGQTWPEL